MNIQHDPSEYIRGIQQILISDKKRIGFLFGAGSSLSNKNVNPNYEVHNFGQLKGLTFDRVLLYPTEKMLEWIQNNDAEILDETRAKFYVGLTRAKYSVGIVCNTDKTNIIDGIMKYI